MDDDGVTDEPIPIVVSLTVKGDTMHLDFTGSGPESRGDLNVVRGALLATVYYAVKAVLDPSIPANGGFYRAITVEAPEGTIVNARPPAPVGWRTQTCQRIADVIFGALAQALPERVPAAGNGANAAMVFSGVDPARGGYYVYLETHRRRRRRHRARRRSRRRAGPHHQHLQPARRVPRDGVPAARRRVRARRAERRRRPLARRHGYPARHRGPGARSELPRLARSRAHRAVGTGRRRARRMWSASS